MAITVGTLKDFCRERASSDNADTTANREFMGWINSALDRLYKVTSWDRTVAERKITVAPRESVTDAVVTQGSLALSSATGFLAKYLSGRWELLIDGYARSTFELDAIAVGGLSATLRAGDEWTEASDTGVTIYFLNTRFALPKVKNVLRVQVVETGVLVKVVVPHEFDHRKQLDPGSAGDARYCTWRQGFLEIWPCQTDSYRKLSVTYQREFTRIADDADDDDEVDWDEEEQDVLEKAILVQAALTQGENSPISYKMAKQEYQEALESSKGFSQRVDLSGPMGIHRPPGGLPRHTFLDTVEIEED